MDERLLLAQPRRVVPGEMLIALPLRRRRPGPSPAPISASPWATAREAAAAAPRADSVSDSPRARSAASVAECVQPAPWVAAATSLALERDLVMLVPVEEVVGRLVAVAPGDERSRRAEPDERLGQLGWRRVRVR